MNTMKMKNGSHYKIQKSQDGGGDNAHKIFTSQVEEGYVPNTTSYVEMFMNTMKIKNNFCNGYQYKKKKSRDGEGNNAYKNFMSQLEEGYIPNTTSYVKLFMNTMKIKNNFCNGYQYKMQKSRNG